MQPVSALSYDGIANIADYLLERTADPAFAAKPYLRGPTATHSFGDVARRAAQVGHFLRTICVKPDDRVMFSVLDGPDFPAIFLGAMQIGAVSLPINSYLKPTDYAYYLTDSAAAVLIVDAGILPKLLDLLPGIATLRRIFTTRERVAGFEFLDDLLAGQPETLKSVPRGADEMAFWLYSSGSTGAPKGVVHSHDHIFWATELFGIGAQKIGPEDLILCPPKMFFAYGLGNQVYFPLRQGAELITSDGPMSGKAMLEMMLAHRPTAIVSVPTLFAGVLSLVDDGNRQAVVEACARLRICVSGGEVLPPSVLRRWKELTGVDILDGVGTTEMTHMFMINDPSAVVPGSCGFVIPGYRARLVDENWDDVPVGEIGSLFVQGPTAAQAYWNKPEQTARTMRDGGVLTGDRFYQDEEGRFFYVGRNDDMLRVGGIWVSPAEIESALTEHPAVMECAVIGHPDDREMIKPKAYVVARPGSEADPDALIAFLRERLAHYKCPRWIDVVDQLPKTSTGKIQRFRLREEAARNEPVAG